MLAARVLNGEEEALRAMIEKLAAVCALVKMRNARLCVANVDAVGNMATIDRALLRLKGRRLLEFCKT